MSSHTILVVEDNPLTRKMLRLTLESEGYEVLEAGDRGEALQAATARRPDMVVLDYVLPDTDGLRLLAEVRALTGAAELPALVVTGMVSRLDELRSQAGPFTQVLPKPIEPPQLLEFVRAHLAAPEGAGGGRSVLVVDDDPVNLKLTALRSAGPSAPPNPGLVADLHREPLQVQLERQTARNEVLVRQAAIQATALSVIRGLSEALAQPQEAAKVIGDVLVHCLDAAGLSTGLLYLVGPAGRLRLEAQFGIPSEARADAEAGFDHPELLRRIVESGQPVAFSFGSLDTDIDARRLLSRLGYASVLLVPFAVLGQSFGLLVLASDTHNLAESAWLGFARSLAAQFGQTLALGQSLTRLAVSESRLRALMEQANDGILILDLPHRILEANREAERLLGRPRDEIVGRNYDEFVVPEERDASALRKQSLLTEGTIRLEERHFLRADGTRVPVEVSASLVRLGEDAREAVVLAILRDVTERKQSEAALRKARERLEHVVSSSQTVLYSLRIEAERLAPEWTSENVERLTGYAPGDTTQEGWWLEHVHPDDREDVVGQIPLLLSSGAVNREYRFRHRDGTYRWLRDEQRLLRDFAGDPVEVVGSWSDVTAQKDAELRMRESEEQYRLLFDRNPHPMWVYDAGSLAFLAVNEAAIRHYGYSREEFLGMTIKDIRRPEDVPDLLKTIRERPLEAEVARRSGAFRHRKKDGTPLHVEVASSSIPFQGWDARLVLAVDVTEKRSLEAQLLQSQKMESVGRLAGGVAHDFNNILGVITGSGELLSKRLPPDPRLRKYTDDILKAAHRAAALTRQLLAFSRSQVLQPRILDLNSVVGDMEKMLRRVIGEDVELVTAFDPGLLPIKADAGQLEQVLMNLVVNARDAMPRGGRLVLETGSVQLDEKYASSHAGVRPGAYAMLSVSDTGHGMPPEVQAHIFEPFFTTKEPGKGTGLGLATVHGIVRQSGGHIYVYSEPGRGTTFKVYLPTVEEAPAIAADTLEEEIPPGTETILVVEDEGSLREIIQECLEASGYTVLQAPHGAAALELSARHPGPIHLLVTDVVMPGMGGSDLARQMSARRPELRVLYMSGYTDDAVILHGVLSADMPFLEKPFTTGGLARKVREVLDRK